MPHKGLRPHEQRLPPALNVIALASFAASLSGRALDPVLPHVAEDLTINIATAARDVIIFIPSTPRFDIEVKQRTRSKVHRECVTRRDAAGCPPRQARQRQQPDAA